MPEKEIKKVGVIVKPGHEEAWKTACELSEWVAGRGVSLVGEPFTKKIGAGGVIEPGEAEQFGAEADLIVVLGGDGTMISTARLIADAEVLVLGINYGSLGYLTDFRIEEMFPALEAIFHGNYEIDRRVMLHAELWRD